MSTRSFRHHASLGVCLGLGLLALAGPTQAQPAAPEPSESFAAQPGQDARALSMQEKAWTLPRLIEALHRDNPQLRSLQGSASAAQFGVEPARASDNPNFSITQDPLRHNPLAIGTSGGMTWSLSQNLPWPGKRALAGEVAQAQADQAKVQIDVVRVQLVGQLKAAWLSWQQIHAQIELTETQLERLVQIREISRVRYANNAAAYADYINAQVSQAQLATDLVGLKLQAKTLEAQINTLLGRPASAALSLEAQRLDALQAQPELEAYHQLAVDQHPSLKASKLAIVAAERAVALAELGKKPDFNVGVSFHSAAPPWGMTNNASYGISVGVTFPLFYDRKERHLLDQAKAQLAATRDADEALRQQTWLAVDSAYLQLRQGQEQLQLIESRMLDQAKVAYRLTLSHYSTGQSGFVDLLNAFNAVRAAELAQLQARGSVQQAQVALDTAAGNL